MTIETPTALQFIIPEDIFLLKKESVQLSQQQADATDVEATPSPVIVEPAPLPIVEEPAAPYYHYHGGNKQRFLIICHYPETELMDDKHLEALKSTLLRKTLSMDDVAIVNLAKYQDITLEAIHSYFKPERMLMLGDDARVAAFDHLVMNQLHRIGTLTALYTHSFGEMMGDRDKTKAFWEQMKVL